jgi:hypothetical protein
VFVCAVYACMLAYDDVCAYVLVLVVFVRVYFCTCLSFDSKFFTHVALHTREYFQA